MDVGQGTPRLRPARRSKAIIERRKYPAKVVATLNRREALKDADVGALHHPRRRHRRLEAMTSSSRKNTVSIPTSATARSISGIFRALRTIPVMRSIVQGHGAELCPDAILLNYTNPMAMLCRAFAAHQLHQGHRPLPQRPGNIGDAGQVDRRADGGDQLRLRGHQPHVVVRLEFKKERQGRLPGTPQGRAETENLQRRGNRPQRNVPRARPVRHRIQRAQFRVQLVVPQAPRPDREILPPRAPAGIPAFTATASIEYQNAARSNWKKDIQDWFNERRTLQP